MPYKKIINLIKNSYEILLEKTNDSKILFLDVERGNLEALKKHLKSMDINSVGSDENSLLIYAIRQREYFSPDIIHYLIEQGINIEHANRQSTTALLECVSQLKDYPIDKPYLMSLAQHLVEKSSQKNLSQHLGIFGNSITTACVKEQFWLLPHFYEKGLSPENIYFNYSNLTHQKDSIYQEYERYMVGEEKKYLESQMKETQKEIHKHHKI